MRDFLIKFFAVCGVLTMFGLMQACFSDSNANNNSGLSKAEVEAMIAEAIEPLQAEITALKSGSGGSAPYNRLYVSNDSATAMMKATADGTGTTLADLGDPIDCEDDNASLIACRIITPTGALAKIPLGRNPTVPAQMVNLLFTEQDCQGDAYVIGTSERVVVTGAKDGRVFYHSPESQWQGVLHLQSRYNDNGECNNVVQEREVYKVKPNDPAITGIESAYDGSVTFGR